MAEKQAGASELDALAFELFKSAAAAHPVKRGGQNVAVDAYRKAEAFLAVRDRIRAGELAPQEPGGPKLADCCAPNLRRTHPHNLVSQRLGDLAKVHRIKQWLDRNPTQESDPAELVAKLAREFPDLDWDMPTINTARAVFPAYAKN